MVTRTKHLPSCIRQYKKIHIKQGVHATSRDRTQVCLVCHGISQGLLACLAPWRHSDILLSKWAKDGGFGARWLVDHWTMRGHFHIRPWEPADFVSLLSQCLYDKRPPAVVARVPAISAWCMTLASAANEQFSDVPSFLLLDGVINTVPLKKTKLVNSAII